MSRPSLVGVAPYLDLTSFTTRAIPSWPLDPDQAPSSYAVGLGTNPARIFTATYTALTEADMTALGQLWTTTGTSAAFLWPAPDGDGWLLVYFTAAPAFSAAGGGWDAAVTLTDRQS